MLVPEGRAEVLLESGGSGVEDERREVKDAA